MLRSVDKPFYSLNPAQLLALLAYGEARSEQQEGQEAIMFVVLNRVKRSGWFVDCGLLKAGLSSIHTVTLKNALITKTNRFVYQFSTFNDGDPNRALLMTIANSATKSLPQANVDTAWSVINHDMPDITQGAVYYYNPAVCQPTWIKDFTKTVQIGKHIFMK